MQNAGFLIRGLKCCILLDRVYPNSINRSHGVYLLLTAMHNNGPEVQFSRCDFKKMSCQISFLVPHFVKLTGERDNAGHREAMVNNVIIITNNMIMAMRWFASGTATITKTCPYNVYPFEPHVYSKTTVCRGISIFFLLLLQNIDCGYPLEPLWPQRGGSNVHPQSML